MHFSVAFALFVAFYDHQNMSSKSSDSDQCSVSDDSEFNYIPGNYTVIEPEIMEAPMVRIAQTIST